MVDFLYLGLLLDLKRGEMLNSVLEALVKEFK
jgi:hypothetical protein